MKVRTFCLLLCLSFIGTISVISPVVAYEEQDANHQFSPDYCRSGSDGMRIRVYFNHSMSGIDQALMENEILDRIQGGEANISFENAPQPKFNEDVITCDCPSSNCGEDCSGGDLVPNRLCLNNCSEHPEYKCGIFVGWTPFIDQYFGNTSTHGFLRIYNSDVLHALMAFSSKKSMGKDALQTESIHRAEVSPNSQFSNLLLHEFLHTTVNHTEDTALSIMADGTFTQLPFYEEPKADDWHAIFDLFYRNAPRITNFSMEWRDLGHHMFDYTAAAKEYLGERIQINYGFAVDTIARPWSSAPREVKASFLLLKNAPYGSVTPEFETYLVLEDGSPAKNVPITLESDIPTTAVGTYSDNNKIEIFFPEGYEFDLDETDPEDIRFKDQYYMLVYLDSDHSVAESTYGRMGFGGEWDNGQAWPSPIDMSRLTPSELKIEHGINRLRRGSVQMAYSKRSGVPDQAKLGYSDTLFTGNWNTWNATKVDIDADTLEEIFNSDGRTAVLRDIFNLYPGFVYDFVLWQKIDDKEYVSREKRVFIPESTNPEDWMHFRFIKTWIYQAAFEVGKTTQYLPDAAKIFVSQEPFVADMDGSGWVWANSQYTDAVIEFTEETEFNLISNFGQGVFRAYQLKPDTTYYAALYQKIGSEEKWIPLEEGVDRNQSFRTLPNRGLNLMAYRKGSTRNSIEVKISGWPKPPVEAQFFYQNKPWDGDSISDWNEWLDGKTPFTLPAEYLSEQDWGPGKAIKYDYATCWGCEIHVVLRYKRAQNQQWVFEHQVTHTLPPPPGNGGSNGGEGGGCFAAETEITMADGSTQFIDRVQLGEWVLSYNRQEQEFMPGRVVAKRSLEVPGFYEVLDTRVTGDHPYMVRNIGEVLVKDLEIGMEVLSSNGEWFKLTEKPRHFEGPIEVYNLTVEQSHTYFANGVWVHNKQYGLDRPCRIEVLGLCFAY